MSTRNFRVGSRDLASAAATVLDNAANEKGLSISSAATLRLRFNPFAAFVKARGVGRMELITHTLLREYSAELAAAIDDEEMQPSYAQNLISAVNTVLGLASGGSWQSFSPTRDGDIPHRIRYRTTAPTGFDIEKLDGAIEELEALGLNRAAALCRLARSCGHRSKEGALSIVSDSLDQATAAGSFIIKDGTKGGRVRHITITSAAQIDALSYAARIVGAGQNLIPSELTWAHWRATELKAAREVLKRAGIKGFHDLRASFACGRYVQLTGHPAPVLGGGASREADLAARAIIAGELGHGRIDVLSAYVGRFAP